MNLVIQADTYKDEPLEKHLTGNFDTNGGSIGRAPTNTLCLPDPERHISRLHAEVFVRDGSFFIRNVGSSNPIILNGRVILPTEEAPLNEADNIAMGSYRLSIALSTQRTLDQRSVQAIAQNRTVIVPSSTHAEPAQPYEQHEPSFGGAATTAPMQLNTLPPEPEPEPEPLPPAIAPLQLDLEPFAPTPETQKPTAQQVAAFSSLLGETAPPDKSSWTEPPSPAPQPHTSSTDAPSPARPWYKFGSTTASPVSAELPLNPQPEPAQKPPGILRPAQQMAETTMPAVRVSREAPLTISPPKPMPPIPGPGGPNINQPFTQASAASLPAQQPIPQPVATQATAPSSHEQLWNAFCEGAGVSIELPQGLNPELMRILGQILSQSIEGTLKLVSMRTAAKQELRAQVTTIQSRNNNPLKFSPNAAVAIEQLLQPPARGFMVGPAAVTDAMDDLLGHASGTMRGMRAALAGVLQRFEPQRLESKLSHQSMLDTLLPMNRRAKLWELYLEQFQKIQNEAEQDFHELFGKAFLKAYDEQINHLHHERSTQI